MAKTKGVSLANIRAFVEERFGREAWERVLERLDAVTRDEVRGAVAMGWYDIEVHHRLLVAMDQELGKGDLALVAECGRYQADRDFTLIHRVVLRFSSPSIILTKIPEIWKRYHDSGRWEVVRPSSREIVGRLHGWGTTSQALRVELSAWMVRAMELVGAREVRIEHQRSRARGDPHDEWFGTWG